MVKKLTIKRVDPNAISEPESFDKSEIRERAASQVHPVQNFGGTFVVVNEKEEEFVQPQTNNNSVKSVMHNGAITVVASENEESEMEEVSYEEWSKDQSSDLSNGKLSPTDLVKELVGKSVATAENLLRTMKDRKEITEFRIVPIGAPMSLEYLPGRVQVLSDHSGNVVDIEIS